MSSRDIKLGVAIRHIRKSLNMNQPEFAAALGFKERGPTVSTWEHGKQTPDRETLEKIAKLAGTTYAEVFAPLVDGRPEVEAGQGNGRGDAREQPAPQNTEWLPRLLELVLTGDYGKDERLELTQQINAAARMQNALWEAAAAYRRAGAMQLEGGAALGRASGIEEEAKSASARALSIAPQQPGAAHPPVPTQTPTPTDEGEGEQGGQRKAV
jgi:transcriptional regulator with XRE-family HTH domain